MQGMKRADAHDAKGIALRRTRTVTKRKATEIDPAVDDMVAPTR